MLGSHSLALVSRCLQAMLLLIPAIRRHFQLRLATKQHILLTQFDQVTQVGGRRGEEGGREGRVERWVGKGEEGKEKRGEKKREEERRGERGKGEERREREGKGERGKGEEGEEREGRERREREGRGKERRDGE